MNSKLALLAAVCAAISIPEAFAATAALTGDTNATRVAGVPVTNASLRLDGSRLVATFDLGLADMGVKSNRAVVFTPAIVEGADTLSLNTVGVYGRRRYIHLEREGSPAADLVMRASEVPESYTFTASVPYDRTWMDEPLLILSSVAYGCCANPSDSMSAVLAQYLPPVVYVAAPVYAPVSDADHGPKTRHIEGSAWIQFPVDRTEIYPEQYNNPAELAKIRASIDSVRTDADITITGLSLKGFASPESPYAHNTDLARGRTESLRRYVQRLYDFPAGLIVTDFEPEDWAGLRAKVEASNLEHRDEILAIIDDPALKPDPREKTIKSRYPDEYRFMLTEWYPALRHTDYRINYVIREFTDPDEVRRLALEAPQKLSVAEFYLAAQHSASPEETARIWDTAVRMYPNDRITNLNAASVALSRGDVEAATRYLDRAGDSPEALYHRGSLAVLSDDYAAARSYFEQALEAGISEAANALEQLSLIEARGRQKTTY